ncbi:MAG: cbb3-type cytochrome c oxidase subunit 3 [Pseudomonadota bacterium]|nr:cbb3-type cytochrome c oxidase subunit 3 [Pseudomonadota bacterium]
MNDYETLRQLADTVGLTAMAVLFVVLCFWPFRPGSRNLNNEVANSIFEDQDDGE